MSFQISKNRMSFQADDKARSRKLTNSTQQVIGRGTSHVLDEVTYDAADKIHHVIFQFRAYFPALTSNDLPSHFSVRINDGFAEPCTHTLRDYYVLGSAHVSCNEPITKIEFAVSAKPDKHFTIPAGSAIHYGAQPNESTPTDGAIASPPAVISAMFNGVPADCEASVALDSDKILFIKADVLYTHSMASNSTTIAPLQASFPDIPTGLTVWLIGAGARNLHSETHVAVLCSDQHYYHYDLTLDGSGYPTFVFNRTQTQASVHVTGSWHWGWLGIDTAVNTEEVNTGSLYTKGSTMYLWSGSSNYMANYPSGQGDLTYGGYPKLGARAYGGAGQPFEGLPHELDCIFCMPDNATAYAFKGSSYYKLQLTTQPHEYGVQAIGGSLDSSDSY